MKTIKKIVPFGFLTLPFVASADTLSNFIGTAQGWVRSLTTLLVGVAVVVLIVGIIRYITAGEDEERRTKARGLMIYGIIGLFVMVSMWGLVGFLGGAVGINRNDAGTVNNIIP